MHIAVCVLKSCDRFSFGVVRFSVYCPNFIRILYKTEQENLVRGERDALPLFCFIYDAIECMLRLC